jgi:demethylmenaquinone methyltransferase / 2-methoxy-6-polyprenyl-1,4-benzoquinol methylase
MRTSPLARGAPCAPTVKASEPKVAGKKTWSFITLRRAPAIVAPARRRPPADQRYDSVLHPQGWNVTLRRRRRLCRDRLAEPARDEPGTTRRADPGLSRGSILEQPAPAQAGKIGPMPAAAGRFSRCRRGKKGIMGDKAASPAPMSKDKPAPPGHKHPGYTHFGYEEVPVADKQRRVREVFSSVASSYDVMNDLMSFGIHRLWKRFVIDLAGVRPGERVLDVAGGTGDLSREFRRKVGPQGLVVLSDINAAMLQQGHSRLADHGVVDVPLAQANAEKLPFAEGSFDCITIGFGLRNVTDKDAALASMCKALKPGGRLLVLEFSKPLNAGLAKVYDEYSFRLLPLMGKLVAKDADSYRYLAESIRMHPDQATLKGMMERAGLSRVQVYNLTGGIVAVHRGYRLE